MERKEYKEEEMRHEEVTLQELNNLDFVFFRWLRKKQEEVNLIAIDVINGHP